MADSKLQSEIISIPSSQRFFTGKGLNLLGYYCDDACVFGYGTNTGTKPLEDIPAETKGLYFYYGSSKKELLHEILKLPIVNNLEYLAIGITHNVRDECTKYADITALLSEINFPKLKFFEYGVDELIANECCVYGDLGELTGVLNNMPLLEKLHLYGNFSLTKPLAIPRLTNLETRMIDDGIDINGGKITNATLQNLLSSKFESLQSLSLDLYFNDNEYDYSIPEKFLNGDFTPRLENLEIDGKFRKGTRQQIADSALITQLTEIYTEEVKEP